MRALQARLAPGGDKNKLGRHGIGGGPRVLGGASRAGLRSWGKKEARGLAEPKRIGPASRFLGPVRPGSAGRGAPFSNGVYRMRSGYFGACHVRSLFRPGVCGATARSKANRSRGASGEEALFKQNASFKKRRWNQRNTRLGEQAPVTGRKRGTSEGGAWAERKNTEGTSA